MGSNGNKEVVISMQGLGNGREMEGVEFVVLDAGGEYRHPIVVLEPIALVAGVDVDRVLVDKFRAHLVPLVDRVVVVVVVQGVRVDRCVAADQVARAVNPRRHRLSPLDCVLAVVRLAHFDALEHQLLKRPFSAKKREAEDLEGELHRNPKIRAKGLGRLTLRIGCCSSLILPRKCVVC